MPVGGELLGLDFVWFSGITLAPCSSEATE